jgi:HD-GYP domain-containing protein (c-di-GMP phosphodiesterase class II)
MPTSQADNSRDRFNEERSARLIELGIALSAEADLHRLLEKVVSFARELTNADGGTLYILSGGKLHFRIIQNSSLNISLGGAPGDVIDMEPVALERENVSGYAALSGETINIEDVYSLQTFDFTGPKRFDEKTGYHSSSMLVVPMKDHLGEVIGVLQLTNAVDGETGEPVTFNLESENLTKALASQAAVAITNARLIRDVRELFDALVRVLAAAVDAKSPYTGNHVQRVAILNLMIAQTISEAEHGPFADVRFTPAELEEIRLAGWLHDVGKVTTPTWVMDKGTKLQTVFDRIELIRTRFELIAQKIENDALRARLARLEGDGADGPGQTEQLEQAGERLAALAKDFEFLERVNVPKEFVDDEMLARLDDIAGRSFEIDGERRRYLSEDEHRNLSIRKGTLNAEEIQIMRDHVSYTGKILAEVPFKETKHLKNVALYAKQHHEKLNGQGYPTGLGGPKLPLQSRILAVADFYEALAAKDRPYKKPMPPEVILKILRAAAADGEIDSEVLELMVREGLHEKFEAEFTPKKAVEKF